MTDNFDKNFHSSAIIDEGANIGQKTRIWHWSHICAGAEIGSNCSIGQNVFVSNFVKIGNNVKIQNNVSVFDNVVIEDNVFCGPSVVFTNVINPRSEISRKSEYKKTLIKKGASLGANCTILCGVEIGEYAFIGAGAVVNRNIKPYALVVGVPAKQKGWISAYGESFDFDSNGNGCWYCSKTGDIYKFINGELSREIGDFWTKNSS